MIVAALLVPTLVVQRPVGLPARAARHAAPVAIFDFLEGLGSKQSFLDPASPRGLDAYAGGITSKAWYIPPKPEEASKLLFCYRHEAVRHELIRLERLCPALQYRQKDHPSFDAMIRFFEEYVDGPLSHLVELEEAALFPAIASRCPIPTSITERRRADSETAPAWGRADIDEVYAALRAKNGQTVGRIVRAFVESTSDTLYVKERTLAPLLDRTLSESDVAEVEAAVAAWAGGHPFGAKMAAFSYSAAAVYSTKLAESFKAGLSVDAQATIDATVAEKVAAPREALIVAILGD